MKKRENFLTNFSKDYGIGISFALVLFSIIIPSCIWISLYFELEKGAESSWSIGVGLFGSLVGGLCTLIAFLVSNYQTKKIQKENLETTIKIQTENVNLTNNQFKLMILNDKIKDYKNLKFQLFELRDKVKSIQYTNFDYILGNMQDTISYIRKDISNLNVEVLCIEDVGLLCWFKKILVDLSKTIDLIYGESYFGDITPGEMLQITKKKFDKNISEFLSSTEDTKELLINTEILQAYSDKYNLIKSKKS